MREEKIGGNRCGGFTNSASVSDRHGGVAAQKESDVPIGGGAQRSIGCVESLARTNPRQKPHEAGTSQHSNAKNFQNIKKGFDRGVEMIDAQGAYLKNVQATYRYYCFHVHNGGREKDEWLWYPSRFHQFLCDTAQEFLEKPTEKAYEILILNCPPQHGKSTTITATLPSWYLMRNPDNKVIAVSYGDDLAQRFGKQNLDKVQQFGAVFGVKLDRKKANAKEFRIANHTGVMISAGYGSGLTGNPADLIIIDDPVKNRVEADSETDRNKKWTDYIDSIESRISAGGKIILIMTRWHEDDLAGRLMEHYSDRVTVANLPCEAEENDILGRKPGEALCPEIGKGDKWLADFKAAHLSEDGVRSWNALYQGRPTAREGNILKREWWQYYDYADYEAGRLRMDTMIMSVDAAFKDEEKNDYVSIGVWGKIGARIYGIDCDTEHRNFTDTIRRIKVLKARYPQVTAVLIEDKANGTAIIQVLKDEIMGIIPISPDASKEARVNAVSHVIEAGNVYLPKDRKWVWGFIEQCAAFPNGRHDDMVDQCSQALSRLIFTRTMRRLMKEARKGEWSFHVPTKKRTSSLGKGEKINVI